MYMTPELRTGMFGIDPMELGVSVVSGVAGDDPSLIVNCTVFVTVAFAL